MSEMFVWIIIVAGATIGLLGTFLIASERELKSKRQQLVELQSRLTGVQPEAGAEPTVRYQPVEDASNAELIMNNKKLEEEISTLSMQLDEGQHTIDELRNAQHRLAEVKAENEQLQAMNRQLTEDVTNLRIHMQAGKGHAGVSYETTSTTEAEVSRLKIAMVELQQNFEESQLRVRELETAQQQLDDLTADLAAQQDRLRELDLVKNRLAEMEQHEHHLRDENQRLRGEVGEWQKRLAESEARGLEFAKLRQRLEELQSKHASLAAGQQQFQEDLSTVARLLEKEPLNMSGSAGFTDSAGPHNGGNGLSTEPLSEPNDTSAANAVPRQNDGEPSDSQSTARGYTEEGAMMPALGKGKKRSRLTP
jgi:chromosome segregation ATPase